MDAELESLIKKLGQERNITFGNEYGALKTEENRFSYTLRLAEEFDVKPKVTLHQKNCETSVKFRKEGNAFWNDVFWKRQCDKILELYTKSVAFAELNSPELAYAYGNRSAVFFDIQLYDHCLLDIDRALSITKSEDLKAKLLRRRENCLHASGGFQKSISINTVEVSQQSVSAIKLHRGKNDHSESKNKNDFLPQRKLFDEQKYIPKLKCDNPEIPGATGAIEICYDEEFGRYIKAARDIKPGEAICIQKGYSTILMPYLYFTHCSYCLSQTWSSVPCLQCATVVYCDETCRDKAWKSFHDVECGVISSMVNLDMNFIHLMSLRLAIQAVRDAGSFEALKTRVVEFEMQKDPRTIGMKGIPPVLDEEDYYSVYTLATNTELRTRGDLFGRSFHALFAVYFVAVLTNFLGKKLPPDIHALRKNPWVVFLGSLMSRHQQIIPTNVHSVTESINLGERERGASLIPLLSLFNHSCDPMVTRVHYGTNVVVYALYPIKAGEQIFDNYGSIYSVQALDLRQRYLKRQYHFTCKCQACIENWPTFHDITSWMDFQLTEEAKTELIDVMRHHNECLELCMSNDIQDRLDIVEKLTTMISTLCKHIKRPCQELCKVVETLKRVYALLSIRWQTFEN